MDIPNPHFTIIIPALNRPDTLVFTIKTVLRQDYDNYSILVSDNFSDTDIKKIVDSFADTKIKYIRTSHRMSMSHHWEFALDHVNKGYVTILGDDDGLVNNSLEKAAKIIKKHQPPAIGWRFANFNWEGLPPHFMIPMDRYYCVVDARQEVEKIFRTKNIYHTIEFPSLYGGFVKIDTIKELKAKYGGVFFHSRIPDFFSGAIIAATVKNYVRLNFPLSINATSKHSTGFTLLNSKTDQTLIRSLVSGENNIPFHQRLIFIRSIAVPIAEAMLQVKELEPSFPEVDFKQLIKNVITEAANASDINSFESIIKGIKEIALNNGLEEFCLEQTKGITFKPSQHVIKQKFSPVSNTLYFNTTGTEVNTVEDAANILHDLAPSTYFLLKLDIQKYPGRVVNFIKYLAWKVFSKYKNNI